MGIRCLVAAWLVLSLCPGPARTQESPPRPESPADAKQGDEREAERQRLLEEVRPLLRAGKTTEAIAVLEEVLGLEREVFGNVSEEAAETIEALGMLEDRRGDLAASRGRYEELLELRTSLYGAEDWRTMDARASLNDVALRSGLSDEGREKLEATERLNGVVYRLWQAGHFAEAIPMAEEALRIRLSILGENHLDTAISIYNLAAQHQGLGALRAAVPLFRRAVGIMKAVYGTSHPHYAQSLSGLAALHHQMGEYAKARPLYRRALEIYGEAEGEETDNYATVLGNFAALHIKMGELTAAETLCRRVLEIWKEVHGEDHPSYASGLSNLALLYQERMDFGKAEPLYRRALDILRKAYGEEHPSYLSVLTGLGTLDAAMGEYEQAEALFRRVLETGKRIYGTEHATYATNLNDLANVHFSRGEYSSAERLYRQAAEIREKALGEMHPLYAESLNNLGTFYSATGEFDRAEPLYRQALEIRERALGEMNWEVAVSLNNLAQLRLSKGETDGVEPMLTRALEILRNALGEDHEHCSVAMGNLAEFHRLNGDYAEALALHRKALETRRGSLDERHPRVSLGLHNIAMVHEAMGDLDAAESFLRQAMEAWRTAVGEEHPGYAESLASLALLCFRKDRPAEAERLCRRALGIRRKVLDSTASVQSERQQLRMSRRYRGTLDAYLVLSAAAGTTAAEAYTPVLAWKGAIHARQAHNRIPRADPAVSGLFDEFDSTSRRLATISLSVPSPAQSKGRDRLIRELDERKERLARELSLKSEAFRELSETERLTPSALQECLPPGVVLVDFLDYVWSDFSTGQDESAGGGERRLLAFIVPGEGEIRRVELGSSARVAEAIDSWRSSVSAGGSGKVGERLRRLLWEPLRPHLAGAKTVLVSPDGALNRFPLAALPGVESGTWLIEEVSLALIPVPQQLPALLARDPAAESVRTLLLVGDVDYDGVAGATEGATATRAAAGTRSGALHGFGRLPATKEEVQAIGSVFSNRYEDGRVSLLLRGKATESAIRASVSSQTWVHFATHGFFAPPEVRSALAGGSGSGSAGSLDEPVGYHPGLLSGLALAGANSPPEGEGDDGILTATEVASLDLSGVEAAVLSACETGLGEVAGGEGVLGLQRAFQVAGARTTVTSLWSVPDRATRVLMERFYRNLWVRKLPKLEAIREAQLFLLNEWGASADVRRGLGMPDRASGADDETRLPPYYWAGWVLSGDWR